MHAFTILCPVDYSACSKRALRYAGALAAHFGARTTVAHVADPLLVGGAAIGQMELTGEDGRDELRSFVNQSMVPLPERGLELVVLMGSPAVEIVRLAEDRGADIIVMGTHGLTGMRKVFFGSTARGILRRSRIPVLAVPFTGSKEADLDAPLLTSGPVIAPIDFSPESRGASVAAAGLASALGVPLVLVHVVTPPQPGTVGWEHQGAAGDRLPARDAGAMLDEFATSIDVEAAIETRLTYGGAAEEIARIASDERASVVVMSLGSAATRGRGQLPGSVAYGVLCLAPTPILALPETPAGRFYVAHLQPAAGVETP